MLPGSVVKKRTTWSPDGSTTTTTVTETRHPDGSTTVKQEIVTVPASANTPKPQLGEPDIFLNKPVDPEPLNSSVGPSQFPVPAGTTAAQPLPSFPNEHSDTKPVAEEAPFSSEPDPDDEAPSPAKSGFSFIELAKSRRTWRAIALLSLIYDLVTDAIVLFSIIPEELENVLAMTFAFDLIIFGFFIWNWKETTDPPYSFRKLFIPMLALMGILVPDVAETTISVVYMRNCGINFIFFVKLLKNAVRMPIEFVQSSGEFLSIQKWYITNAHGEAHYKKGRIQVRCSLLTLAGMLLLCGIVVPLVNMNKMEGGECQAFA